MHLDLALGKELIPLDRYMVQRQRTNGASTSIRGVLACTGLNLLIQAFLAVKWGQILATEHS